MPLDPDPVANGNVLLRYDRRARKVVAIVTNVPLELGFRSHFASCRFAEDYR